jgi:hypothetical protein
MIDGKTTEDIWFDNWMVKPPLIDASGSLCSVLVFFEVDGEGVKNVALLNGFYCGQFNFAKNQWHIIPSYDLLKPVPDKYVKQWMHIPDGEAYTEPDDCKI